MGQHGLRVVGTALAASFALAACGGPKDIRVEHAWVRLAAVRGQPAAAYFTLHGGPKDATLINVTTDVAIKSEMHDSGGGTATASMKPLTRVPLPAHSTVAFRPGGRHVMLYYVNPGIKPGGTMRLTFTFADGARFQQVATVIAPGAPAPK